MNEYFIKSIEQLKTLLNFPKLLQGTGCEFEMDPCLSPFLYSWIIRL